MNEPINFKDILIARRIPCGTVKFMTRTWNPKKTMEVNKYCTPQDLKDIVANSAFLDSIIEAESVKSGFCKEKLKQEIKEYIDEIGLDLKMHVVRWMGVVFLKMSSLMKVGVFVNETQMLKLRDSMGKNPILFLPTHRSYVDISLMTYINYNYDIQFPAVAAGMDFASMAIVGKSLQNTSAFYIRRTLAGAHLYGATLLQYVRSLVASYNAPVQFFLEGTRSRSNKSLAPKYGMLSMSLLPLFSREVSDITAVPIHISYDRLVEHALFAYEHLGVPKPKESTGSFLKVLRSLNDHYGNIYINIGTPISLNDYIKTELKYEDPSETIEMLKPLQYQQLTAEQFRQVQRIADYVVALQQKNTVTNTTNIVALVLMGSLIKDSPLSFDEVVDEAKWLVNVAKSLGAVVLLDDVVAEVKRILVVHNKMMILDKTKRLRLLSSTLMNVSEAIKTKMKGHILKAETMVNAVPIVQLQLYVNPTLYYLVPPALICAILRYRNSTQEQLATDWRRIRKLLKYEFFYDDRDENDTFKNALQWCKQNKVIIESNGFYSPTAEKRLQYLLKWTIWPALTTLLKCTDVMTELQQCEHKKALKVIQQQIELSECHPYCLSLEVAANCLQGLVFAGALLRHKSKETVYELVPEVMVECRLLVSALLPSFNVVFGRNNAVMLDQRVLSRL